MERRALLAFSLRERAGDTAMGPYFTESRGIAGPVDGDSRACTWKCPLSSQGALAGSNEERPSVWLIHSALRCDRSAGKASAFFSVSPLKQEIQKKIASENAKRQKKCR